MKASVTAVVSLVLALVSTSAHAATRTEGAARSMDEAGFFEKLEYSGLAGTAFAGGATAGVLLAKAAYRLPIDNATVFAEPSFGVAFNTDGAIFPIGLGGRWDFAISDTPRLTPFVHASLGPAFATSGGPVVFDMFVGPGAKFKLSAVYDLRIDTGLVVYRDSPGFQFLAGVAL